jgi:hypothetical protein
MDTSPVDSKLFAPRIVETPTGPDEHRRVAAVLAYLRQKT